MDGSIARPRPMFALGLRLMAAATLATMGMLVKLGAQHGVHLAEMVFWRQAVTLICVVAWLGVSRQLASIRTTRIKAHAARSYLGLVCMFFVYGAVILLPLPEATAISFTAPFFAVMLSVILFREKVGIVRWGAVALGFAGVLLITRPGSGLVDPIGAATGLVAAAMVALISIQIQDLNKTESPWSIIFWFAALTTPFAALAVPFVIGPHDGQTWLIILAMALCGALAQILLTSSLRFGSASVILLIDYTSLLWATWYGYSVFDRAAPATLWLGAPLIIGAGLLIAYRERSLARQARQP